MAVVVDNIYTKGISGRVGDALLYKVYGNKTVVCRFPRPSLKPPTSRQLAQRKKFALAVFKTRTWLADNAKRLFLEGLERKWAAHSTYHAGIRYFMTTPEAETTQSVAPSATTQAIPALPTPTKSQAQKAGNAPKTAVKNTHIKKPPE